MSLENLTTLIIVIGFASFFTFAVVREIYLTWQDQREYRKR